MWHQPQDVDQRDWALNPPATPHTCVAMRLTLVAPLVTPLRAAQLGGAQAVVADLARGLVERGEEVEVVATPGSSLPGVTLPRAPRGPAPPPPRPPQADRRPAPRAAARAAAP